MTRDLRNAVYRHLAHLPLGYFTQMKAGQILSRVINDTFEARLILTQIVTQGLQSASLVVVYIAILFSISWKLSLIALIILPLLGVSLQPMLKRLRKGNLRRGNVHGEMTSVLQETISGIRLVKASGTDAGGAARYRDNRNLDCGARAVDRSMAGVAEWNDDRSYAARIPDTGSSTPSAVEAALSDAHHRSIVSRLRREVVRDPGFTGRVSA